MWKIPGDIEPRTVKQDTPIHKEAIWHHSGVGL